MRLSAPSYGLFLVSFILALLVILIKYFGITVPVVGDIVRKSMFEVMLVSYVLLFIGVVFRRL